VTASSRDASGVSSTYLDGDVISALNWVYQQRLIGRPVASVNMSFNNNVPWTNYCDSSYPALANIVQALYDVGVFTVVSAGNQGFNGAMSYPACLSGVMSVANSTKADNAFHESSNRSALTKISATGEDIYAALPNAAYASLLGTSQAAPQVAGAIAVLRSNYSATTNDIRTALLKGTPKAFGYSGPDWQLCAWSWLGCVVPRLDVGYANDNFYGLTFGGGF
jgi:subtilisin family serine protease